MQLRMPVTHLWGVDAIVQIKLWLLRASPPLMDWRHALNQGKDALA
jgi:hypothetical protein